MADGITELVVRIPDEAMPLVEQAALSDGWRPTITNEQGETVANPEVPLLRTLLMTIRMIRERAIDTQAPPAEAAARAIVVDAVDTIINDWTMLVTAVPA